MEYGQETVESDVAIRRGLHSFVKQSFEKIRFQAGAWEREKTREPIQSTQKPVS